MPRVISGTAKKCVLASLPGIATRPTSDRIKESMFNILSRTILGANVLDLFSGTGALGIEALSRGASHAVFIDNSPACVRIISDNLAKTGFSGRSEVVRNDSVRVINSLTGKFDLIFMDPPYGKGLNEPALKAISGNGVLSDGGIIVAETGSEEQLTAEPFGFEVFDRRDYGRTSVFFLRRLKNMVASGI